MSASGINAEQGIVSVGAISTIAVWYLLRTKAREESRACDQVKRIADNVLLPLVKGRVRRGGRLIDSVFPLFPGYLFATLDLKRDWRNVCYARGVREIVRFGDQVAVVPEPVISELFTRCANGPFELRSRQVRPGERIRVIDGPFREFEGVFERPLGSERVAILLSVLGAGSRAILPAEMIVPAA